MKGILSAAVVLVLLSISFLPVFADSDETELTGGFVPIGIGGQAPSSEMSEPPAEEEPALPASEEEHIQVGEQEQSGSGLLTEETPVASSSESSGEDNETELSTEVAGTPAHLPVSGSELAPPQTSQVLFSDGETIEAAYELAVRSMAADGILNGFEDGSFRPTDTLTREQGAKIVAYLLLGADKAETLTCGESLYTDVEADRWSAPVIVWCTEQHVLHGMGDGTFHPADKLTGAQFAKMLLCAYELGDPERYVGDGWLANIAEDGEAVGLFDGDAGMKENIPIQRQQAALLAENARNAVR